jgi:Fe-S cluster assembly iron-binding protein IscA
MALDEPKQDDELTQVGEFKFAVDKDAKENYSGFYVDYSNEWLRRGFRISPIGEESSHC